VGQNPLSAAKSLKENAVTTGKEVCPRVAGRKSPHSGKPGPGPTPQWKGQLQMNDDASPLHDAPEVSLQDLQAAADG